MLKRFRESITDEQWQKCLVFARQEKKSLRLRNGGLSLRNHDDDVTVPVLVKDTVDVTTAADVSTVAVTPIVSLSLSSNLERNRDMISSSIPHLHDPSALRKEHINKKKISVPSSNDDINHHHDHNRNDININHIGSTLLLDGIHIEPMSVSSSYRPKQRSVVASTDSLRVPSNDSIVYNTPHALPMTRKLMITLPSTNSISARSNINTVVETVNNLHNDSSIEDTTIIDHMTGTQHAFRSDHRYRYEPNQRLENSRDIALFNTPFKNSNVNNNDVDRTDISRYDNAIHGNNKTQNKHDGHRIDGERSVHDRYDNDDDTSSYSTDLNNHDNHGNVLYQYSQPTHHHVTVNHRKHQITQTLHDDLSSGVSLSKGNLSNLRGGKYVRSMTTSTAAVSARSIINTNLHDHSPNRSSSSTSTSRNTGVVLSSSHLDSSIDNHNSSQYQHPPYIYDILPSPKPTINLRNASSSTTYTKATSNDVINRSSGYDDNHLQIITDIMSPIIRKSSPSRNRRGDHDNEVVVALQLNLHDRNDRKHLNKSSNIELQVANSNNVDQIYHKQPHNHHQQQHHQDQTHQISSQSLTDKMFHQPYRYGPEIIGSPAYSAKDDYSNKSNISYTSTAEYESVHARSIDIARSTAVRLESACSAAEYLINSIATDVDRLRGSETYPQRRRHDGDHNSDDDDDEHNGGDDDRYERENSMNGSKMEVTMSILEQMMTTMKKSRTAIAMISGLREESFCHPIDSRSFDSYTTPSSPLHHHVDHQNDHQQHNQNGPDQHYHLNSHHHSNDHQHEHTQSQTHNITTRDATENKASIDVSNLSPPVKNNKPIVQTRRTSPVPSHRNSPISQQPPHQNHRDVETTLKSTNFDDASIADYRPNHHHSHTNFNHSNNILHSNSDVNNNDLTAPHDRDDLTDSTYRYNGFKNIYSTAQSIDDVDISQWNNGIETDLIDGYDNDINNTYDFIDENIDDHQHTPMNQDYHLNSSIDGNCNNTNHSLNGLPVYHPKDAQLIRSGHRVHERRYNNMSRAAVARVCIAQGSLWKV